MCQNAPRMFSAVRLRWLCSFSFWRCHLYFCFVFLRFFEGIMQTQFNASSRPRTFLFLSSYWNCCYTAICMVLELASSLQVPTTANAGKFRHSLKVTHVYMHSFKHFCYGLHTLTVNVCMCTYLIYLKCIRRKHVTRSTPNALTLTLTLIPTLAFIPTLALRRIHSAHFPQPWRFSPTLSSPVPAGET